MKTIVGFFSVCLLACLISASAFGQKPPIKFGDVPTEQIKQGVYEKDTSAAAYYIADYGKSEIRYTQGQGFQLYFEKLARIKIVKKEGLEHANFSIPLYHRGEGQEKLTGLKAVTYNFENGKVVESKTKNEGIFKEKRDENWDITKVTMPNVKVGSVVEYSYSVASDFLFNFQDWEFQHDIPALWSEYRASIPEYFSYDKYTQGYLVMTEQGQTENSASLSQTTTERKDGGFGASSMTSNVTDYRTTNYRWAIKDVPAFKEEPMMTNAADYYSKINFELTQVHYPNQPPRTYRGTWEDLNREMMDDEEFGKAGKSSGYLGRIVEEKTAGMTNPADKIAALYSFVRENTEWNGDYRMYCRIDFKRVLENKKASSAEINLLLVGLLQKAGLIANPVLVSTRNHGFVRENMAVSSQFNYVIAAVKVGDKFIPMDATDHSLPMNLLPKRCLNGNGFMVSETNSGWIELMPGIRSKSVTTIDLTLQADGGLKGKVAFDREGYYAQEMRKKYFDKGEADYCKSVASDHAWELHKSEFGNINKLAEPVNESHQLTISEQVQTAGEHIYLNPLLFDRRDENQFKAAERHYPVDFGNAFQELYTGKINIPEGYVVEELPKPKVIALPNNAGRYLYSLSQIGSTLAVTSQLSINSALFTSDEYPNLREFYAQVVAKQAEQIVLKKR